MHLKNILHCITVKIKAFLLIFSRDPAKRPSAKEALKHPWLKGSIKDRSTGRQLNVSVVQRIQRFAQSSKVKKSILQLVAEELLLESTLNPEETKCALNESAQPVMIPSNSSAMQLLFKRMQFDGDKLEKSQLASSLAALGYKLTDAEVDRLMEEVDTAGSGHILRSAFAASQVCEVSVPVILRLWLFVVVPRPLLFPANGLFDFANPFESERLLRKGVFPAAD